MLSPCVPRALTFPHNATAQTTDNNRFRLVRLGEHKMHSRKSETKRMPCWSTKDRTNNDYHWDCCHVHKSRGNEARTKVKFNICGPPFLPFPWVTCHLQSTLWTITGHPMSADNNSREPHIHVFKFTIAVALPSRRLSSFECISGSLHLFVEQRRPAALGEIWKVHLICCNMG